MLHNLYSKIFIVLFLVLSALQLFPQRVKQVPEKLPYPVSFYALNFITEDTSKSRLDVRYRIPYDFLVFVRNTSEHWKYPLIARVDITIEILNEQKLSVAREFVNRTIGKNEDEPDINKKQFVEGIVAFTLNPGNYFLVIDVRDIESNRRYFNDSTSVRLKRFFTDTLEVSDAMFFGNLVELESTADFSVYENVIPFGIKSFNAYFELPKVKGNDSLKVTGKIFQQKLKDWELFFQIEDTLIEIVKPLMIVGERDSQFYKFSEESENQSNYQAVLIKVSADSLKEGEYQLEVSLNVGTQGKNIRQPFSILWIDKPKSLSFIELTIDAMEHIMEKEEFIKFKGATISEQRKILDEFWYKQDPTPNTAFNEVMVEYFRRSDYAFQNFRTFKEMNGIRTDRGKTYIVYGPPTKIERKLPPNAPPREEWFYVNMNRKFIFIDRQRNGNYYLVAVERL